MLGNSGMAQEHPVLSKIASIVDLMNECRTFRKEIDDMNDDVREAMQRYMGAGDLYTHAITSIRKNNARMEAALANCKTGGGGKPEEPEEPEPAIPDDDGEVHIVRPKDPNDKLTLGHGAAGYLRRSDRMHYTIRFENVPNAEAPAGIVEITDQLTEGVDWNTVELGEIGFNHVVVPVPTGRTRFAAEDIRVPTDSNITVNVQAAFDPTSGLLHWFIIAIDPVSGDLPDDPLVGFLPPNDEDGAGEGYVTFSVELPGDAPEGHRVVNSAVIDFGILEPIWTPPVTNTVDNTAPVSAVQPLQAESPKRVRIAWAGDDHGGSGIKQYDIYRSRENGPFELWLAGVTDPSVEVDLEPGIAYAFRSIATDHVGHREPAKIGADAATRIAMNIVGFEQDAAGPRLQWESAAGKTYRIRRGTNLLSNSWMVVVEGLPASPPVNVYTGEQQQAEGELGFFAIEIE